MEVLRRSLPFVCWVLAFTAGLGCASIVHAVEPALADVEFALTITVKNGAGTPIPDVRLAINDRRLGLEQQVKTNAAGQAVTTLRWDSAQAPPKVWVAVTQYFEKSLDSAVGEQWIARYMALLDQYHFEPNYEVKVPSSGGAASLDIVATDAIKVTGHLPAGTPSTIKAFAVSHQGPVQALGGFGQSFVVRGLKRGTPALVGVHVLGEPESRLLLLSAAQTASNVDLGEVTAPDWEGTNIVRMTITDSMVLEDDMPQGSDNIALISADGTRVFSYGFDRAGRVWRQRQLKTEVALPAGKYYLAPGAAGIDAKAAAVLGVVRQGEPAADKAGIPSIQVADGGPNQFTISGPTLKSVASALPAFP
jgi:hypothetical protein